MIKDLIDKLKLKRKEIQNFNQINISSKNNIYEIKINDYVSINDYNKIVNSSEEYKILNSICSSVLWNGDEQKINKGTYYVIIKSNHIYNILLSDEKIVINERTKINFDEQSQNENILQDREITLNINKNEYKYCSTKHDKTGDTFYIKYYFKNKVYDLGPLELSEKEVYDEVSSVVYNLQNIEGIKNIINIELFELTILDDLSKKLSNKNKKLKKL